MRSTAAVTFRARRVAFGLFAVGAIGVVLVVGREAGAVHAATAPTGAPALFPKANEFLYVRSRGAFLTCRFDRVAKCKMQPRRLREVWMSERRDGLLVERPSPVRRSRILVQPRSIHLGNRRFSRREMAAYAPTGPGLLAELQAGREPGQRNGGASYPYVELTDALREAALPPKVRQAVVDALPLVPGVEQLGARKDALGRPGVAFARNLPDTREEVIVDPVALVMLEERTIMLNARVAPGAGKKVGDRIGGAVYLERAVVGRAGQRP